MNYYLLVYNREKGILEEEPQEFQNREEAWEKRLSLELKQYKNEDHIETVVFGAMSLDDLKKTHGRYFFDYKFHVDKMQSLKKQIREFKKGV